jgi:lipopolysaccharide export system permease protein
MAAGVNDAAMTSARSVAGPLGLGFIPILDRYVMREVASNALAGFLVVLAIFLVTRLSTLLSDAAVGGLPGSVVASLLALRTVVALPSLLPAVLYLGVLLAMNRMSRDRELLAMETSGVGPGRLDRAVIGVALCAAVGIAVLSFAGRPWAAARFNEVRDRAIAESGLDDITPGVFYELHSAAQEVVFAESRSATDPATLENVFVQRRNERGIAVFSAARAVESRDASGAFRLLVLHDGLQYDLLHDGENTTVTAFERLAMQIPSVASEPDLSLEKTLSIGALTASADPEAAAELQWRSAMPISAVLLCLLAVPLGRTSPRQGRAVRILLAAILYVGYRTLLGTAKSWVGDGVLPVIPGLWLVHAACFLTALALGRAWRTVGP